MYLLCARAIPAGSPSWHRRARLRRSRARALVRRHKNKQSLKPSVLERVASAVVLLESHHSAPKYKVPALYEPAILASRMSWKGQKWSYRADQWNAQWDGQDGPAIQSKKRAKEKNPANSGGQQQERQFLIGYDGKKVELKQPAGSLSLSSASSSATDENKILKEAVRYLLSKTPEPEEVPHGVKSLVAVDPREELRLRQKELNQEKKH